MPDRLIRRATVTALTMLVGCAPAAPAREGDPHAGVSGGTAPTTSRALAYVASLHVGEPDLAEPLDWGWATAFPHRSRTAVDLRFGRDGEDDGGSVMIIVGTGIERDLSSCETLDMPAAGCTAIVGGGLLTWDEQMPEEDPGLVLVVMPKGETTVLVSYAGPAITDDPREMDLPVSTETLVALAADPRVDTTTTDDAVARGADLAWFRE